MKQISAMLDGLLNIATLLSAIYLLSIVIVCLLFFLCAIAKSFEPEPWEK